MLSCGSSFSSLGVPLESRQTEIIVLCTINKKKKKWKAKIITLFSIEKYRLFVFVCTSVQESKKKLIILIYFMISSTSCDNFFLYSLVLERYKIFLKIFENFTTKKGNAK